MNGSRPECSPAKTHPSLYAYFQEFTVPDTGERLTRKGFIGLGAVEDYDARVVHRHEQTLSGPKKDRLEVLNKTRAHFGQIFMLYPDPERAVDRILDEAVPNGAGRRSHGRIQRRPPRVAHLRSGAVRGDPAADE